MKKFRFVIIAVALVAAFHFIPLFNGPEAAVVRVFSALAGGGRAVATGLVSSVGGIFSAGRLTRENKDLNDKLGVALGNVAALAETKQENETLRGLIEVKKRTDLTLIGANVIGVDPSIGSHAIVLDRGSESGVAVGDAVVYGAGIMVGKVAAVAPGRATVLLTVDPKCAVAALVAGHPEANGAATGDRGLVIKLGLIPHDAEFNVGDVVLTSGGEAKIPRDLVLGAVDSVSRNASEPFSSATVIPSYDQNALTVVAVVHKN